MLFERFEDKGLAQYSYAVGCASAGKLAIVDPRRDIDVYLAFAEAQEMEITHVLETHIHADYASGARELANRTGAELRLSAYDKGELYEVAVPHREFYDGDSLEIGSVRIQALHTPGHTPEHLTFLVYDGKRSSSVPQLMLSGDFLFVGSLGRPDLLGAEAKRKLAEQLFESVTRKIKDLPDGLEIHPGHGAGSMCGAGMNARPLSTLGFERTANPYLDPRLSREEFVAKILSSLPPFPDYYRRMKQLNSDGPALLDELPDLEPIEPGRFRELAKDHAIIDLRDQLSFGAGHIAGSFGIGAGTNLSTWASWVVSYDKPLLLVASEPAVLEDTVRFLVRVGLDQVKGYLKGGIELWMRAAYPLVTLAQISPGDLHQLLNKGHNVQVLDVRSQGEWDSGHIEGALHNMAADVPENLHRLDRRQPLALVCGTGYRSTVAASLLEQRGFQNLINVTGGMQAWVRAGLPTTTS